MCTPPVEAHPTVYYSIEIVFQTRLYGPALTASRTSVNESGQANRQISTGQLNTLLHLHFRPINLVVFEVPRGISGFGGGFTLICFQRLSVPNIATLRCR